MGWVAFSLMPFAVLLPVWYQCGVVEMVNRFGRFILAPSEAIQCDHMVPPGLLRLRIRTVRTGVQVTQHFVHYTRCKSKGGMSYLNSIITGSSR